MTLSFIFVLIFGLGIVAGGGIVSAVELNGNEQFADEQKEEMHELSSDMSNLDVGDDNEIYIDDDNNNIEHESENNDAHDDDDDDNNDDDDGDDDNNDDNDGDDDDDDDDDSEYHDAKNCGSGDKEHLEAGDEGWIDDEDYDTGSGSGDFAIDHGGKGIDYEKEVTEVTTEEPEMHETGDESKYDVGEHHVCSEEYSMQCTAPLDNIESFADIGDEFCENREHLSCLQNIFENCVDDEDEIQKGMRYLEELNRGVDLVCLSKGSESTTDPLQCLSDVSEKLSLKVIDCTTYAMKETESLMEGEDLTEADKKCLGGHLVIECVTDAATEMCGKVSGNLLELGLESDLKDDPDVASSIYCQEEEREQEEN